MPFSGVLDAIKEFRLDNVYAKRVNDAQRIFDAQRMAVSEIAGTKGFAEICAFFEREYSASVDRMIQGYNAEAAARASLSRAFLEFLNSRKMPLAESEEGE